MSEVKEDDGGQSRPFGSDRMQFCFRGVESAALSSGASVWLVGCSGKR